MLEPGPNMLEPISESLEGRVVTEGTYGTGAVRGGDVEGDDADGGGVEDVKRTVVVFRFAVRYPGSRGRG